VLKKSNLINSTACVLKNSDVCGDLYVKIDRNVLQEFCPDEIPNLHFIDTIPWFSNSEFYNSDLNLIKINSLLSGKFPQLTINVFDFQTLSETKIITKIPDHIIDKCIIVINANQIQSDEIVGKLDFWIKRIRNKQAKFIIVILGSDDDDLYKSMILSLNLGITINQVICVKNYSIGEGKSQQKTRSIFEFLSFLERDEENNNKL